MQSSSVHLHRALDKAAKFEKRITQGANGVTKNMDTRFMVTSVCAKRKNTRQQVNSNVMMDIVLMGRRCNHEAM